MSKRDQVRDEKDVKFPGQEENNAASAVDSLDRLLARRTGKDVEDVEDVEESSE